MTEDDRRDWDCDEDFSTFSWYLAPHVCHHTPALQYNSPWTTSYTVSIAPCTLQAWTLSTACAPSSSWPLPRYDSLRPEVQSRRACMITALICRPHRADCLRQYPLCPTRPLPRLRTACDLANTRLSTCRGRLARAARLPRDMARAS